MRVPSAAVLVLLMAVACANSPPELPPSFAASTADRSLIAQFGVLDIWQVRHPAYAEPLKILVSEKKLRSFVDYQIAFFFREGDTYTRIGLPMTIGGYDRPVLGTHPELPIPVVIAKITDLDEMMYVFVSDGSVQSASSDEDGWFDADEHPLIEVRDRFRELGSD